MMNRRIRKFIAVISAIAMVISSLTVYEKNISAAQSDAESYDWSTVEYVACDANGAAYANKVKAVVGSGSVQMLGTIQKPGFATEVGIYITFGDASFGEISINGEVTTAYNIQGAGIIFHMSGFSQGANSLIIKDASGNEKAEIYVLISGVIEESTGPVEVPEVTDGAQLLKQTDFASDANDKWVYTSAGESSSAYNGDGSVTLGVPAYAAGNPHDTQLVQTGITLVSGKWYKAKYTVTSDAAKSVELRIQTNQTWTSHNPTTITAVGAGETVNVEVIFQAVETTTDGLFGIMLGYVNGTGSDASTVTISNASLTGYNDEAAAKTVLPVTSVTATGKVNSIDVSWTPQGVMPTGTQYYVYLDDSETESAIVTDTTSTTLTGVSAGYHIVTVKACVNGVFSAAAESPQANVTAGETNITNLTISSTKPNQVEVSLDAIVDAAYIIELVDTTGTTVATINECIVAGNKATCVFTGVEKGTYTVKATVTVGETTDTQVSNSVDVKNAEAQEVNDIVFDTTTYNKVVATWTVVNNQPVEGQTYKVYLDGAFVAETDTMTYTFNSIEEGKHTVKVTGVLETEETTGREEEVVATAAPITIMGATINQVTSYNGKFELNDNWSYEYPIISTDCYLGVDANNNIVAYSPLNREQSNFIYQSITGLEIGKYYTYSYTVAGSKSQMAAIPVHVYSEVSEVNHTVTPGTEDSPTVVTRTFCADVTDIGIRYDVGRITDGTAVKISPVTVTQVTPLDVTSITATGRVDAIDVEWVKDEGAVTQQTYILSVTNTATGETTEVARDIVSDSYQVKGLEAGSYTVTLCATINGEVSTGVTSTEVTVGGNVTAVTSTDITVEGFQIRTNDVVNQDSVAFRTVCKAPNVGTTITGSDGNTYTVANMGTIYTIDTNWTGYKKNNKLNPIYTILNETAVTGQEYSYVGANLYDGAQRTYGYIATEAGYMSDWNTTDTANTYYVRTMTGMDAQMAYSMHVRAFVVATDGTIIYGKSTAVSSVAQIADYLYKNSMSKNYSAHKYLYDSILNSTHLAVNETYGRDVNNLYYRDVRIDYGWNGILYVPGKTATLTTNTLDSLQTQQ